MVHVAHLLAPAPPAVPAASVEALTDDGFGGDDGEDTVLSTPALGSGGTKLAGTAPGTKTDPEPFASRGFLFSNLLPPR